MSLSVKEQVRMLLENNKTRYLSGEEMAENIGCTRAAVWKAVKMLKNDGCEIEGVNNKGYRLNSSSDTLSEAYIREKLVKDEIDIRIEAYEVIDSTNSLLKRYANDGITEDMIAIAAQQTAGRGRRGRSFYSPSQTGVYLSLLLHPKFPATQATSLTTVAAVALAKAIEEVTGFETSIKWVNDIYMRGKKIAGILTEAQTNLEDNTLEYCIVGIGINLYLPEGGFPEEIKEIAGAVISDDKKRENLKNDLAVALIKEFMGFYRAFPSKTYLSDYEKRCFCIGREVNIITSDHELIAEGKNRAKVLGIDEDCHLKVEYQDGTTGLLSSGEISIRL